MLHSSVALLHSGMASLFSGVKVLRILLDKRTSAGCSWRTAAKREVTTEIAREIVLVLMNNDELSQSATLRCGGGENISAVCQGRNIQLTGLPGKQCHRHNAPFYIIN